MADFDVTVRLRASGTRKQVQERMLRLAEELFDDEILLVVDAVIEEPIPLKRRESR